MIQYKMLVQRNFKLYYVFTFVELGQPLACKIDLMLLGQYVHGEIKKIPISDFQWVRRL